MLVPTKLLLFKHHSSKDFPTQARNGTFIQLVLGSVSNSLSCPLLVVGCIKACYPIRSLGN